MKEESMSRDSARVLQLPLFVHDTVGYLDAISRYEAIRPVLKGERSLPQQSRITGINYGRLWRDLQRFQRRGLLGLIHRRTLPHARGQPGADVFLPRHIQQQIGRLAMAHPFTARELARIVRDGYHFGLAAATIPKPTVRPARSDEEQLSREETLLEKFKVRSSTFSRGYSSCRPSLETLFSGKL
jgi:hypothetical protein